MTPKVTVCGLGPGGSDRVTTGTLDAIDNAEVRLLRTDRHPSASLIAGASTFDHVYESADSFAEVYERIADEIVEVAATAGSALYAVPGSPLVLENSVRRLVADERIEVELLPALSFLDEIWARLAIDPIEESVRLVDGHRFALQAAGERGPLVVAHVHAAHVLSDIKLALDAGEEQRVTVLQRLGTEDERIFEVAWPDLDRLVDADHLTSLFLAEVAEPVAQELVRSVDLMHRLRQDCPWDRAQDHGSLRPFLIEETYEVIDALDAVLASGDAPEEAYADLEEELGDLWFQILFHAELATEAGQFTIADVAATMHEKMVRRHPHVFAGAAGAAASAAGGAGSESLTDSWERIKNEEKPRESALDGIPTALPSLAFAAKLLERAERAGAETDPAILGRRPEDETVDADGLGRMLLATVALARQNGVDPEAALRRSAQEAAVRFRAAERSGTPPEPDWVLG